MRRRTLAAASWSSVTFQSDRYGPGFPQKSSCQWQEYLHLSTALPAQPPPSTCCGTVVLISSLVLTPPAQDGTLQSRVVQCKTSLISVPKSQVLSSHPPYPTP